MTLTVNNPVTFILLSLFAQVYGNDCGGTFRIHTEQYFNTSTDNNNQSARNCQWKFEAWRSNLRLNLTVLDLDKHSVCTFNSFIVYDGPERQWKKLGKLCHTADLASSSSFKSGERTLTAVFYTRQSGNVSFKVEVFPDAREPGWNREIWARNSTPQFLESPNYPQLYPTRFQCWWLLRAPSGLRLQIESVTFDMEDNWSCVYSDRLTIYDGDSSRATKMRTVCASKGLGVAVSSWSSLYLQFQSDSDDRRGSGFRLRFQAITDVTDPDWNREIRVLNSTNQFLQTPNYPQPYPPNFRCWWLLRAPPGLRIRVESVTFDLEGGRSCSTADRLIIHDGNSIQAPVIRDVCGDSGVRGLRSQGNALYLEFQSDYDDRLGNGFRLRFHAINDTLECSSGYMRVNVNNTELDLVSPDYPNEYPRLSSCSVWFHASNSQHVIRLAPEVFTMQYSGSDCTADFMEVYDGKYHTYSKLARWCGSTAASILYSSGQDLYVWFHADFDYQTGKFRLQVRQVPQSSVPSSSSSGSAGLPVGAILGGFFAALTLIGIGIGVGVCCYCRKALKATSTPRPFVRSVAYQVNSNVPTYAFRMAGGTYEYTDEDRARGEDTPSLRPLTERVEQSDLPPAYADRNDFPLRDARDEDARPPPPPPSAPAVPPGVSGDRGDNRQGAGGEVPPPSYGDVIANEEVFTPCGAFV